MSRPCHDSTALAPPVALPAWPLQLRASVQPSPPSPPISNNPTHGQEYHSRIPRQAHSFKQSSASPLAGVITAPACSAVRNAPTNPTEGGQHSVTSPVFPSRDPMECPSHAGRRKLQAAGEQRLSSLGEPSEVGRQRKRKTRSPSADVGNSFAMTFPMDSDEGYKNRAEWHTLGGPGLGQTERDRKEKCIEHAVKVEDVALVPETDSEADEADADPEAWHATSSRRSPNTGLGEESSKNSSVPRGVGLKVTSGRVTANAQSAPFHPNDQHVPLRDDRWLWADGNVRKRRRKEHAVHLSRQRGGCAKDIIGPVTVAAGSSALDPAIYSSLGTASPKPLDGPELQLLQDTQRQVAQVSDAHGRASSTRPRQREQGASTSRKLMEHRYCSSLDSKSRPSPREALTPPTHLPFPERRSCARSRSRSIALPQPLRSMVTSHETANTRSDLPSPPRSLSAEYIFADTPPKHPDVFTLVLRPLPWRARPLPLCRRIKAEKIKVEQVEVKGQEDEKHNSMLPEWHELEPNSETFAEFVLAQMRGLERGPQLNLRTLWEHRVKNMRAKQGLFDPQGGQAEGAPAPPLFLRRNKKKHAARTASRSYE